MLRIFFGAKAPHVENKIMFREIHGPSTDVHDIDVLADVLSSGDRFKKCHGSLAQVKAFAKKNNKSISLHRQSELNKKRQRCFKQDIDMIT